MRARVRHRFPVGSEMPGQFVDEPIHVTTEPELGQPVRFDWRGATYDVVEILMQWSDWGFSPAVSRRTWRTRRHRNYYRIKVKDGSVYEIYLDRSDADRKRWFLFQRLDISPPSDDAT